ncbi:MAG TPA: hypothetical protein VFA70_10245 [Dehalococcoidia bacterium]|jgi:hypothetical protein|nr:hypothetical protein [Dehalococcoidia bacterium]
MALFLETYTIPHDLPAPDLVRGLQKVNRDTSVEVLRCAYNLSEGKVWCLTEAASAEQIKQASWVMPFAFTLDTVTPVDSSWQASSRVPLPLEERTKLDGVIEPDRTRPMDVARQ